MQEVGNQISIVAPSIFPALSTFIPFLVKDGIEGLRGDDFDA